MRPAHAPKQTLFSSVEYGEREEEKHTPVGEDLGGGGGVGGGGGRSREGEAEYKTH